MTFTVQVGYTTTRPVVPDEHTAFVIVSAKHDREAMLIAAQMVGSLCEMVTRTTIVEE